MLIFKLNQAIHIDSMNNNLLCPMQLRMNDVKVFDCPKRLIENPNEYDHTIIIPGVDNEEYSIPLSLHGVTSYFPTRKPTMAEYNESSDHHIDLTYDTPEWQPHSETFNDQEVSASGYASVDQRKPNTFLGALSTTSHDAAATVLDNSSKCSGVLQEISPTLNDEVFLSSLKSNVNISLVSSKKQSGITAEDLVQNWGLG